MELKTLEGKTIKITKACIRVSGNHLIDSGYFIDAQIYGILPKGKKEHILSYSPMPGKIWLRTLYGYSYFDIDPEVFRAFLKSLEVKTDRHDPVTITPEIEKLAKGYVEAVCDCPAIKG